jgi:hypothetical protein
MEYDHLMPVVSKFPNLTLQYLLKLASGFK